MKKFALILATALFVLGCSKGDNSSEQLAEKVDQPSEVENAKEVGSITYRIQKDDLMGEFDAYFDSEYSKKNHKVVICDVNDEEYEITYTEFAEEE